MNSKTVGPTQAQKWVQALKDRTAHITGFEPVSEVQKIVNKVDADFPNQLFQLVQDEKPVGTRRVFGDRSYAQSLQVDRITIECGVMSEGMLGTAANGRMIL